MSDTTALQKFDVEIFDTREDVVGRVSNVPAATLEEACRKVAERKGYYWIGGLPGGQIYRAIDVKYYVEWNGHLAGNDDALQAELAERRDEVMADGGGEFRGLLELYEPDSSTEEWDDEDE